MSEVDTCKATNTNEVPTTTEEHNVNIFKITILYNK